MGLVWVVGQSIDHLQIMFFIKYIMSFRLVVFVVCVKKIYFVLPKVKLSL